MSIRYYSQRTQNRCMIFRRFEPSDEDQTGNVGRNAQINWLGVFKITRRDTVLDYTNPRCGTRAPANEALCGGRTIACNAQVVAIHPTIKTTEPPAATKI